MSDQPLPVCNFICGSPGPNNSYYPICISACDSLANCGLTPNILYTFINGIVANSNLFFSGIGTIIKDRIGLLAFRLAIYQQIPWLFGFLVLVIVLVVTRTIHPSTAILLFVVAFLIAALFVYFSIADATNTITNTFNDVRKQLSVDYTNAQAQISKDIASHLFDAIFASRVPCQSPNNSGNN